MNNQNRQMSNQTSNQTSNGNERYETSHRAERMHGDQVPTRAESYRTSGQRYDAKYDQRPQNTSDYSASHSAEWDKDYRGQQWSDEMRGVDPSYRANQDLYRPTGSMSYRTESNQFGKSDYDGSRAQYYDYGDQDNGGTGGLRNPSSSFGVGGPHVGKGPKGYRRTDDRIREEVCEGLYHHGGVDASDVDVQVSEGVVILSGHVESRQMKRMLEDEAERVAGVRDVRNEVKIHSGTRMETVSSDKAQIPAKAKSPGGAAGAPT